MALFCDVLVIGAGVAGSVAAKKAAQMGANVIVVDKTGGSTLQSSGAFDLGFSRKFPSSHPYAQIKSAFERKEEAVDLFLDLAKDAQIFRRDDRQDMWAATQMGTLKQTGMVMNGVLDLTGLTPSHIHVLHFSGLLGFDAQNVANMLAYSVERHLQSDVKVSVLDVQMEDLHDSFWRSPIEMARWLDVPEHAEAFIDRMHEAISRVPLQSVCLSPPIFGTTCISEVRKRISAIPRCYELLAMPQSAFGYRLSDALHHGLRRESIRILKGEASSFTSQKQHVEQVSVQCDLERISISPKTVILCTGRFFSGGFTRHGEKTEKVFGLGLFSKNGLIAKRHSTHLTSDDAEDAHELFDAGLLVDEHLRPKDQYAEIFALNLFAAGSSLGRYDPSVDKTGLGVPIVTGYLAGEYAALRSNALHFKPRLSYT